MIETFLLVAIRYLFFGLVVLVLFGGSVVVSLLIFEEMT